ncbi:MAG: T9SS type A sorting domain-containing protein, partial [Salinivirgaceae bacterium]|nr:T9SS type A sorting domain-containing protein [Salinivirgaceae bacterium]
SNSGLPVNEIKCVAIDQHGTKWIGTYGGGLAKFDDTDWKVYNTSNSGLPYNSVCTIAIDENNIKWIGTDDVAGNSGGLISFDDINWTVYNTSNSGLSYSTVISINIDQYDNKWIASWRCGVGVFNENGVVLSVEDNEITNREITDLTIYPNPSNGVLNIETENGLKMNSIEITALNGVVVKSHQVYTNEKQVIDINNLPNGIYLLRVTTEESYLTTKLIKQ